MEDSVLLTINRLHVFVYKYIYLHPGEPQPQKIEWLEDYPESKEIILKEYNELTSKYPNWRYHLKQLGFRLSRKFPHAIK